jgi:AraC-like DNA-binding protein
MLSNPLKVNKKANFWFGIFLIFWASFWLDEIIYLTGSFMLTEQLKNVITYIQFFAPIIFYISFIFFTNPNFKFNPNKVAQFLLLPLLYLIIKITNSYIEYDLQVLLISLIIVHSIFYTVKSYLKIKKHQKHIKLFSSSIAEIDLKWLEYIIIILLMISLLMGIFNFMYYRLPLNTYINLAMLITIFFIAYNILKQKEIFPLNEKHREEIITINETEQENTVTKRKIITDEELVELKSKLNSLMKEQKLYLNHDINVASLSEEMHTTTHQLSYIINNGFNQNFFQFINSYRVEKAKTLLLNKQADKLSILGIAFESGFSSKTAFNTTFKKFTNQTPSEFKKQSSSL